jgi:hypothetical protein
MDTAMDVDSVESMSVVSDSDIMEDFDKSISEFMAIEKMHLDIIGKLQTISAQHAACDIGVLKDMHKKAMEHIQATGKSNFGALIKK